MGRFPKVALSGWILLAVATAGVSRAQDDEEKFVPPDGWISDNVSGTLELYQPGLLQVRDSKMQQWLLKITPQTKLLVQGEAEVDYLKPGLTLQIKGDIDKKSAIQAPIEEIEIITASGKPMLGLFAVDGDNESARPARNPGPGEYLIKAKLAAHKEGQITLSVGSRRITGTLGDEVKITFASDDLNMADVGDTVEVKAWYTDAYRPVAAFNKIGRGVAESVTITLAKPLAPIGRKSGRAPKAAAAAKD
jgi:hypothetical protein